MVRWTVIEKAKVCRMLQRDADVTRHRISRGALLCIFGEIGLARSDTDEILVKADSSLLFGRSPRGAHFRNESVLNRPSSTTAQMLKLASLGPTAIPSARLRCTGCLTTTSSAHPWR